MKTTKLKKQTFWLLVKLNFKLVSLIIVNFNLIIIFFSSEMKDMNVQIGEI